MKHFFLFTTLILTLFSCSNDIEFNEHAFQATKDNEFWKASDFSIKINDNGFLNLVGTYKDEVVTIHIQSTEIGVYSLGTDSNSTAWYTDGKGSGFTTEYRGNGEVAIEKYDPVSQSYTGTFRFNAFSSDGEAANFINGVFYQVQLTTDSEIEEEGDLKASVDDSDLQADEVLADNEEGVIKIQGVSADGSFIKLYIPQTTVAGSYNLNEQSDSNTYAVYGFANGVTSTAQFGTLFINEHNVASGMIKGSFTFRTLLPNSVSVENGSFTAYY